MNRRDHRDLAIRVASGTPTGVLRSRLSHAEVEPLVDALLALPVPITDEMVERMALWLLGHDTRWALTSFEDRPAHHELMRKVARDALNVAING